MAIIEAGQGVKFPEGRDLLANAEDHEVKNL